MIQVRKILVPTDFSKFSEHALEYGCELAAKFGAELHLLYVVTDALLMYAATQSLMYTTSKSESPAERIIREEKVSALAQLGCLPAESWQRQLTVHRAVEVGIPVTEIQNYAKVQGIDLVVMGTHGRTGLGHLFLGSVAEKIVRASACPVLTVRHPEHKP